MKSTHSYYNVKRSEGGGGRAAMMGKKSSCGVQSSVISGRRIEAEITRLFSDLEREVGRGERGEQWSGRISRACWEEVRLIKMKSKSIPPRGPKHINLTRFF